MQYIIWVIRGNPGHRLCITFTNLFKWVDLSTFHKVGLNHVCIVYYDLKSEEIDFVGYSMLMQNAGGFFRREFRSFRVAHVINEIRSRTTFRFRWHRQSPCGILSRRRTVIRDFKEDDGEKRR